MNTVYFSNQAVKGSILMSMLLGSILIISGCLQNDPLQTTISQDNQELSDPVARGGITFNAHCVSCHGDEATGTGPIAELLTIKPADLTLLSKNNNGAFPADKVYAIIDGRETVASHGTRQMPIWGNVWVGSDGGSITEEELRGKISEIVEYLRSIQGVTDFHTQVVN